MIRLHATNVHFTESKKLFTVYKLHVNAHESPSCVHVCVWERVSSMGALPKPSYLRSVEPVGEVLQDFGHPLCKNEHVWGGGAKDLKLKQTERMQNLIFRLPWNSESGQEKTKTNHRASTVILNTEPHEKSQNSHIYFSRWPFLADKPRLGYDKTTSCCNMRPSGL